MWLPASGNVYLIEFLVFSFNEFNRRFSTRHEAFSNKPVGIVHINGSWNSDVRFSFLQKYISGWKNKL